MELRESTSRVHGITMTGNVARFISEIMVQTERFSEIQRTRGIFYPEAVDIFTNNCDCTFFI